VPWHRFGQSAPKAAHSKEMSYTFERLIGLWLNILPAKDLMKGKAENEWQ